MGGKQASARLVNIQLALAVDKTDFGNSVLERGDIIELGSDDELACAVDKSPFRIRDRADGLRQKLIGRLKYAVSIAGESELRRDDDFAGLIDKADLLFLNERKKRSGCESG